MTSSAARRRTRRFYETRIVQAETQLRHQFQLKGDQGIAYVCLVNAGNDVSPKWRDWNKSREEAIQGLMDATILRVAVSNVERSFQIYVDQA